MEATNKEEILNKINSGEFKNIKAKPTNKSTKNPASEDAKEDIKEIINESNKEINGKAKEAKEPKAPKAPKAPKEAKAPKEVTANFPLTGHINKYGFLGLSIGICNALSLPLNQGEGAAKLAKDVPIIFQSYDPETKVFTIKVGE